MLAQFQSEKDHLFEIQNAQNSIHLYQLSGFRFFWKGVHFCSYLPGMNSSFYEYSRLSDFRWMTNLNQTFMSLKNCKWYEKGNIKLSYSNKVLLFEVGV